jgi:hypothetical protein
MRYVRAAIVIGLSAIPIFAQPFRQQAIFAIGGSPIPFGYKRRAVLEASAKFTTPIQIRLFRGSQQDFSNGRLSSADDGTCLRYPSVRIVPGIEGHFIDLNVAFLDGWFDVGPGGTALNTEYTIVVEERTTASSRPDWQIEDVRIAKNEVKQYFDAGIPILAQAPAGLRLSSEIISSAIASIPPNHVNTSATIDCISVLPRTTPIVLRARFEDPRRKATAIVALFRSIAGR